MQRGAHLRESLGVSVLKIQHPTFACIRIARSGIGRRDIAPPVAKAAAEPTDDRPQTDVSLGPDLHDRDCIRL